jgi:FOG: CheY-like receiver
MNGKIGVKSQRGVGTKFTVILKTKETLVPRVPHFFNYEESSKRMKALIVEDNHFNAQIIVRYIQDSKLPIDILGIAENGLEAVNFYKDYIKRGENIDLITMDLEMPVMGGKEACKQIRDFELQNNVGPTKIFIVSANCLDTEVNECIDRSGAIRAEGFIRKPVKNSELLAILAKLNSEMKESFSKLKSVLIVDDDAFNLSLLEEMLKKHNIRAILASNGKQAIEICRREINDISLIIMDCEMPVMDGWAATSEIQAFCLQNHISCPPIYGLTGYACLEVEECCKIVGMSKVLTKPLAYHELIQHLKFLSMH